MSHNEGKWEVVGKSKNAKPKVKKDANGVANGVTTVLQPIKTDNLFDLFIADEVKKSKIVPPPASPAKEPKPYDNVTKPKKAKKPAVTHEVLKAKPMNDGFDGAARKIKLSDLEDMITTSKTHFPGSSSIWIKDAAAYLNHLLPYDTDDAIFSRKPQDYPLSALPSAVRDKLSELLESCSLPTLQLTQEHCLETIVKNVNFQLPTLGYRIMIQLIGLEYPQASLNNIQRFIDTRASVKNRSQMCLSVLWAAMQSGQSSFRAGFKLWYDVVYPVASMKSFTAYSIDSLQNLLRVHETTLKNTTEPLIGVKQFFNIFDYIFSATGHGKDQEVQLKKLYKSLKELAQGKRENSAKSALFSSYLIRLNENLSKQHSAEIKSSLMQYLIEDLNCFSVWQSIYSNQPNQSGLLLDYLTDNADKLSSPAARALRDTTRAFAASNAEQKSKNKIPNMEKYIAAAEKINLKMSSGKVPWKSILFILIAVTASVVFYDVQTHGTFQRSVTGRVLKDYGIIAAWNQSQARLNVLQKQTRTWISKNGPVYYAKVDKIVGPYLAIIKEKVLLGLEVIWEACVPIRQWANKALPPIWDDISRNYVPKLVEIANRTIHAIQLILIDVGLWIQTNVLTGSLSVENLQKLIVAYTNKAQEAASGAYVWVSKRLQA